MKQQLEEKDWREFWGRFAQGPGGGDWFAEIGRRYGEAGRRYHNGEHIADCLAEFRPVAHLAVRPVEVELALWLHDVVYDPRAVDNEERSGEFAREVGRAGNVGLEFEERVVGLILATKHSGRALGEDA